MLFVHRVGPVISEHDCMFQAVPCKLAQQSACSIWFQTQLLHQRVKGIFPIGCTCYSNEQHDCFYLSLRLHSHVSSTCPFASGLWCCCRQALSDPCFKLGVLLHGLLVFLQPGRVSTVFHLYEDHIGGLPASCILLNEDNVRPGAVRS